MSEPWDPTDIDADGDPDRPNLLAVASVAAGAVGLVSACGCYLALFTLPLFGIVGLVTGVLARRQAEETGYGTDYVWWGLALGLLNTVVGVGLGLAMGLAVFQ